MRKIHYLITGILSLMNFSVHAIEVVVTTRPDAICLHFGHNNVWDMRITENNKEKIDTFEDFFAKATLTGLPSIYHSPEFSDNIPRHQIREQKNSIGYFQRLPYLEPHLHDVQQGPPKDKAFVLNMTTNVPLIKGQRTKTLGIKGSELRIKTNIGERFILRVMKWHPEYIFMSILI